MVGTCLVVFVPHHLQEVQSYGKLLILHEQHVTVRCCYRHATAVTYRPIMPFMELAWLFR